MDYSFPKERFYHPEFHVWIEHSGERVRIGLTDYVCALAGAFIEFTPRALGQTIYKGRTCCTLESEVWVGPVKSPCGGEIVEINERILERPALINEDPYGEGWLMTLRPIDWGLDQVAMVYGEKARQAYHESILQDQGQDL